MQQDQRFNKIPNNPQTDKPKSDKTGDWISIMMVIFMICAIVANSSKMNKGANTGTITTKQNAITDTTIKQHIEQPATDTTFLFIKRIYEKQI